MKIATWNLERPSHFTKKNSRIIDELKKIDADILVLTESNECITICHEYEYFHSSLLPEPYYKPGERRVSICSKYKCVDEFVTFRSDTSICKVFETPIGKLAVYGTVIGVYGNRKIDFDLDLNQQIHDIQRILKAENICIAGDFNISFSDNYYFTKIGREKLKVAFESNQLANLTSQIPQNIDHIVLSNKIVSEKEINIYTWNLDKKLSDHIGVAIQLL